MSQEIQKKDDVKRIARSYFEG